MRSDSSTWTTAVCCALALLALCCDSGGSGSAPTPMIVGSDIIVSEFPAQLPFDGVDAGIAEAQIVITQGVQQSVSIETDDNFIDEIEMVVFGSILTIFSDANYSTNHGVKIRIDMTDIKTLRFDGVGEMEASGIASAGTLEVVLTGVGSIDLTGTVDTYDALHEGLGEIDAEALTARLADIDLRGVGDCRITVTEELNGSIFRQGDIHYAGHPPTVNPNIVGDGELIPIP